MDAKRAARGLSSVGAHFALTTTLVLVLVLAAVFTELTLREHTRTLAARQSAAENITGLFATSSSAALLFEDADAMQKEIHNVRGAPGVLGAALYRDADTVPTASIDDVVGCSDLPAGQVRMGDERLAVAEPVVGNEQQLLGRGCVVFSLDEENREFRTTRWRMAVRGLVTAIAIAGLLIILSRRRIISPLMQLVDVASSIERGDARSASRIDSMDEIGQLARAFDRMGNAVADREARLRAELATAAHLQTSILPHTPAAPGLELAASMETATEVGGDYYDVIPVKDGCWIGIGDVSGHGLGAGVVMLMIQSAVGALVRQDPDATPKQIECTVNRLVHENVRRRMRRRDHATLTLLRYEETGRVRLAGAHEDILVLRAAAGAVERVETPGTWVGVMPAIEEATEETAIQLAVGDVMVLYTDGLTEAFRGKEQFGIDRLCEVIREHGHESVEELRFHIVEAVKEWSHGAVRDDMTLVVIRHVGRPASTSVAPADVRRSA